MVVQPHKGTCILSCGSCLTGHDRFPIVTWNPVSRLRTVPSRSSHRCSQPLYRAATADDRISMREGYRPVTHLLAELTRVRSRPAGAGCDSHCALRCDRAARATPANHHGYLHRRGGQPGSSGAASVPILVAPTVCYGASQHHFPFPGVMSLGSQTFSASCVTSSIASRGWGHGASTSSMGTAATTNSSASSRVRRVC